MIALRHRPRPDESLHELQNMIDPAQAFQPSVHLLQWVQDCYLSDDGPLFNADHAHLCHVRLGFLWALVGSEKHGRRILGQAEMVRGGTDWKAARRTQQLAQWFGTVPDFVITLDATAARDMDDAAFAALVDHELYHCAQAVDEFGGPRFNQFGEPVLTMRAHDVEEFTGVVRRFGIEAAGDEAVDLVIAAARSPEVSAARLGQACGTCLKAA